MDQSIDWSVTSYYPKHMKKGNIQSRCLNMKDLKPKIQ